MAGWAETWNTYDLSVLKGMRLAKRNNVFLLCLAVWISAWLSVDVSKGSSLAPRTPCPSYDTSSPEATVNTPTLTQSCQISVNYLTLVHIDWHWWWNMHREKQTLSIKRCSPLVGSIKWQKKVQTADKMLVSLPWYFLSEIIELPTELQELYSLHFWAVIQAVFWFQRPKTKREWTPQLTIPGDLHVKLLTLCCWAEIIESVINRAHGSLHFLNFTIYKQNQNHFSRNYKKPESTPWSNNILFLFKTLKVIICIVLLLTQFTHFL